MSTPIIELRDIHLSLGGQTIFSGLSLELRRGESLTIMGASGCGKSLCMKMMVGLAEPDRGEVLVEGRPVHEMDALELAALRRRMALVFQRDALFDSLSILENVEYGLREHTDLPAEARRLRVIECLEMVDLGSDTLDLRPAEISGGMKKRVALARAVAYRPEILLFDEPFEGLDPQSVTRVRDMIKRLSEGPEHSTALATHHLPAAFACSDRFVLIHAGKVALAGTRDEFRGSEDPVVHGFVYGPGADGEFFRGDAND